MSTPTTDIIKMMSSWKQKTTRSMPLRGNTTVLTRHLHIHRHGRSIPHAHWHDHQAGTEHAISEALEAEPPLHEHRHKTSARTALLLILGSSPTVEGIPAFFAASRCGVGLIIVMSLVFAITTIATCMVLCVYSTAGLRCIRLGPFERYGEVISGTFIALVGVALWFLAGDVAVRIADRRVSTGT
jgi:hypothetical protein